MSLIRTILGYKESQTAGMTDEDYKELDRLLVKLRNEIGKKYTLIPDYIMDGAHVAIYGESKMLDQQMGPDIKSCVEKLKERLN